MMMLISGGVVATKRTARNWELVAPWLMKGGPQIKIVSKKYACSFSGGQLKGSLRKMPQVQVDMLVAGGYMF